MKGKHFRLDRQSGRLVAKQLRDQRQIEPLACTRRAGGDLRDQLVPQRAKIGAAERHRREPGKSDPVRAGIADEVGAVGALKLHGRASVEFRLVEMRKQPLDLGDDGDDAAELALQIPIRDCLRRATRSR